MLILGVSPRTGCRQPVLWVKHLRRTHTRMLCHDACHFRERRFGKPVIAELNLPIRPDDKDPRHILEAVVRRDLIWMFIDQNVEPNPKSLNEVPGFSLVILRNSP